jgi:hypothetical protein
MQGAVRALWLFSLLGAVSAHAEIYMCKDASGHTLTSDRPIPECADRAMRQYGNSGMIRKDIPAPPTEEQKQEKLAQQEKKKAEEAAADEQKRVDRALLARYQSSDEIEQARRRDTAPIIQQIGLQRKELSAAEQEWNAIQAIAPSQKQSDAATTAGKVGKIAQKALDARSTLQDMQAELAQVNAKYDQIQHRYLEITDPALTSR